LNQSSVRAGAISLVNSLIDPHDRLQVASASPFHHLPHRKKAKLFFSALESLRLVLKAVKWSFSTFDNRPIPSKHLLC
jgi:hypothetical protein